ncbi:ATP-binding protein [Alkalihalobacillus sp. BA299]|uniref:ATP-binding protein n=1 Tax=Alkalihalobacillus sp. BA299 TaxID=2815938 RepID=UPI001ADA5E32|nr:ATP-binding protein [Alkalihalobacillus sp. BA299]
MIQATKKNLHRQMIGMLSVVTILILMASIIFHYYGLAHDKQFEERNNYLKEKETAATHLEKAFNRVFFEARGYIAFQQIEMLDEIDKQRVNVDSIIYQLNNNADSNQDYLFLSQVTDFYNYYFQELLPNAKLYIEEGQFEELHNFAAEEQATIKVNEFQHTLSTYYDYINQEVVEHFHLYAKEKANLRWIFIIFNTLMMLIILMLTRRMFVRLEKPIQHLATVAEKISDGKEVGVIENVERQDEIGVLSRSFQKMLINVQQNEQELVAQNEELIAQQDELQAQQIELQEALKYKEENERILKRRNELVNALSNTLDRKELLNGFIYNMAKLIDADKGMIVLLDNRDYASIGVCDNGIQQFLRDVDKSFLVRLKETKRPFILERESSTDEKGYFTEFMKSFDIIIPVFSTDKEMTAVMVYTRIGKRYTDNELVEFEGLAKELSLSLDKIKSYEETESQRRLTKEIIDTLREGVQLVDEDGTILQSNVQLSKLLGVEGSQSQIPLSQWLGHLSGRIKQEKELHQFMMNIHNRNIIEADSFIYEIIEPKRSVIKLYYEPLYRNNKKIGSVFVHQDITKQYEIDQMKSEFVSTVSHELRTPLSSILGFSEVLLHKELKPERQQKYLTTIHQESKRLTALINDFLDVQRMESGNQTYEKNYCDVIPIIQRVIEAQKVNTDIHQFKIKQETDYSKILGDKDKLYQAFNNVIANAVKYSPNGGCVTITVYEKETNLNIDIKDEGLGIPKEAVPKLFKKFYRVDNSDRRKIGGTGLGLSIVKEILKAHEGDITVQSEPQSGSTFSLYFPLVKSLNWIKDESFNQSILGTVVIIEDDLSLGSLLQNELLDTGFNVKYYQSGKEAIKDMKAMNDKPGAIVIDIMLSEDVNGWEIITSLKKDERLKDIPIFISSALDDTEKGKKLGVSNYLVKPYEPSKLSKAILQTFLKNDSFGQVLFPVNKSSVVKS